MTLPRKFLVGGEWRSSDALMSVRFPYNDELVAQVYVAGEQDLEDAIQRAQKGFESTRKLSSHARARILHSLRVQMEKHKDELIKTLVMEVGNVCSLARNEVERAIETVQISAEEAKRIGGEIIPIDGVTAGEGRTGLARRFPLGIVLGIVPFNAPLNLACHKLAPAVAAGNAIILKPASATPISALLLGEMLLEAGFPPEALSVLVTPGAKAEKLVADPRIAFFSFTGSSAVGWHLKSIAGRKRMGLELGGNAAVIVHEDANMDYAARAIAAGGYRLAGQGCISVQRVFLHRPIYEVMLEKIVAQSRAYKVGDPRDPGTMVGPMIDRKAAAEAFAKVQEALTQGAECVLGGECNGTLFQPTVLTKTTPQMRVNREEIFAPVITVTPYDDFDQAIRLANNTDYGLQAGVFTQNINRIMRAFEEIQVGGLQVNEGSAFRVDQMPYGGVKGSGIGREGPRYAIEEMTEMRLMVLNLASGIE